MPKRLTLTAVVDEVNDARLNYQSLTAARRRALAAFLAERQGGWGSYCGLFAPVEGELTEGYRFFTGERVHTNAGCRHILGEEALRALILLAPSTKAGRDAIQRAAEAMDERLAESEAHVGRTSWARVGWYCCGKCSIALWRAMAVGAYSDRERRVTVGLRRLRELRDDKGGWRSLPFYYTLSALVEHGPGVARQELRHARRAVESRLARAPRAGDDAYGIRRRRVLEMAAAAA